MALGRRPIVLLLNGVIHTLETSQPLVSALAIDRSSGRLSGLVVPCARYTQRLEVLLRAIGLAPVGEK